MVAHGGASSPVLVAAMVLIFVTIGCATRTDHRLPRPQTTSSPSVTLPTTPRASGSTHSGPEISRMIGSWDKYRAWPSTRRIMCGSSIALAR